MEEAMSYLSDVVVSSWMLLVVVQIIIPLAILVVYLFNKVLRRIIGVFGTVTEPSAQRYQTTD
jgi:hypothetical protein